MSVAANTFPCLYELSDIMSLFLVVARVILCACAASAAVIALPSRGNARYNYTSAKKEHPDSRFLRVLFHSGQCCQRTCSDKGSVVISIHVCS